MVSETIRQFTRAKRPPFSDVWNAGADWSSRRALLGLWCWRYHGIPARNLLRRLLLPRTPLLDLRLRMGPGKSLLLRLRRNDRGDHASFFENHFELPIHSNLCPEPECIADAGAHIGCFSLRAHALWPRAWIAAFEPDAGNAELLRHNFAANGIRGEAVPMAVWTGPGRLEFTVGQSNSGFLNAGVKEAQNRGLGERRTVAVEATSLSSHLGSKLSKTGLVKLDIEGAELEVLEAELHRLPASATVLCELHFTGRHQERFESILRNHAWRAELYDAHHPPHSTWILRRI